MQSKRDYFCDKITNNLTKIYDRTKEIADGSMANEYITAILKIAGGAAAGKTLGAVIPKMNDEAMMAGGALLGVWFGYQGIKEKDSAINEAKKLISVFQCYDNNTEGFMRKIAEEIYKEFCLSLQLLVPSKIGIGVLVKFFISCILGTASELTTNQISRIDVKDFMKELRRYIYNDDQKISPTKLITELESNYPIGWQLDELILHSPVLSLTPLPGTDDKIYTSTVYLNTTARKNRGISSFLTGKVPAEASHKYPPRFLMEESTTTLLHGYRHDISESFLPKSNVCVNNQSTIHIKDQIYDHSMVQLYFHTAKRRRDPESLEFYENALKEFIKVTEILLRQEFGPLDELFSLVNIQTLKNIFWTELKSDKHSHLVLYQKAQTKFLALCTFSEVNDNDVQEARSKSYDVKKFLEDIAKEIDSKTEQQGIYDDIITLATTFGILKKNP